MKTLLPIILCVFVSFQLRAQTNEEKENFMKMAIELSEQGADGKPSMFAAVVVKDGKVVGKGFKIAALNDPTLHGEVSAMRDACKNLGTISLEGCDLYTNVEPCPMCYGAAYWANIKNIYYGITKEQLEATGCDIDIYRQVCLPYNERVIKFESVLGNEAIKVFEVNMK